MQRIEIGNRMSVDAINMRACLFFGQPPQNRGVPLGFENHKKKGTLKKDTHPTADASLKDRQGVATAEG